MGRPKYNNVVQVIDGVKYDSKKEVRRHGQLKLMEQAGLISQLKLKERHRLVIEGMDIGYYESDFTYLDAAGRQVVEDCKGKKTPVYNLKKRLMKAIYGIDILET